jgi:CheY-like chemotaxis protein
MPGRGLCRGHRHSILIVDEDAASRSFLEMRLLVADFDVSCARHGRAALQLLQLGIFPCVILVDVAKASVGGSELRRALIYGEEFRRIVVKTLPTIGSRTVRDSDVADVVAGVVRVTRAECPYLTIFQRPASQRQTIVSAVRPPRTSRQR